jgi:hypothetical protein
LPGLVNIISGNCAVGEQVYFIGYFCRSSNKKENITMKTKMKRLISISTIPVLALTLLLVFGTVLADNSASHTPKPAPTLTGTTDYYFVGNLWIFDAEGRWLAWEGTISGDINGTIQWWMGVPRVTGQTGHYDDLCVILDSKGELLLAVDEAGSSTIRHGETGIWRTNGTVIDASEECEAWLGRQVHDGGEATWDEFGMPDKGVGTFRIN